MSEKNDRQNLEDLQDVAEAIEEALEASQAVLAGGSQAERERLVFYVGFARGRLTRVSDRIRGVEDVPDAP